MFSMAADTSFEAFGQSAHLNHVIAVPVPVGGITKGKTGTCFMIASSKADI